MDRVHRVMLSYSLCHMGRVPGAWIKNEGLFT